VLQGLLAVGVLTLGGLALFVPGLIPAAPTTGSPTAVTVMFVGAAFYVLLARRALRTRALTHRRSDLAVSVGCIWLGIALVPQFLFAPGTAGYYFGHILEAFGVAFLGIPAALDLRRGGASRPLVGDLSATEIVASEEAYLGSRTRALMVALAEKDGSTERHSRRVALLAVRVGEALKLPAATLRELAVGGLIHDIGKLSVPTEVLQKPGRLDEHEFALIKRHPGDGSALLRELGGFSDPVHALVAQHHERLDGSGYPAGLTGAQLAIGPRIMAVCDVYDALVSDRVYRDAWSPEKALAHLRALTGKEFDGTVVYALARVLEAVPARSRPVASRRPAR
jgi:HD-GYP domain-containing protein (c-di-GMP phosphodiesterase class II)